MSSGAAHPPPVIINAAAEDSGSSSTWTSTSASTTSVFTAYPTPISSSPRMSPLSSSPSPFIASTSTPPPRKTSFPASEIDRPWLRRELLSPTRCSSQFFDEGPYDAAVDLDGPPRPRYARSFSDTSSMSSQFSLLPDPSTWGSATDASVAEPDDELHEPDPRRDKTVDEGGTIWTIRGVSNLGCMFLLVGFLLGLFIVFPVTYHFTHKRPVSTASTIETNSTGQVPENSARQFVIDGSDR